MQIFPKALGQYPVVTLVGPRQAGKTTVALAIDSCLVVHGGDEEQCRTEATICPWWKFPVHLAKWLTDHQAAPQAPDLNIVQSALEANRK